MHKILNAINYPFQKPIKKRYISDNVLFKFPLYELYFSIKIKILNKKYSRHFLQKEIKYDFDNRVEK
jgi:hypothetical protein